MNKYFKNISICFGLLFANEIVHADTKWHSNMLEDITHINLKVQWIQTILLWACIAISIVVFGTLLYLLIMHRKSGDTNTQFHRHSWQELLWAVIPFIILVLLALPSLKILLHL